MTEDGTGWFAYGPMPASYPHPGVVGHDSSTFHFDGSGTGPTPERRPELADLGRLARRGLRGAVRAARVDEQVTLTTLARDHLGAHVEGAGVLQESWPAYEQVNVQAALDHWLEAPGREARLVGVVGAQHQDFGLADLLQSDGAGYLPRPGSVSRRRLASGPGGQTAQVVQCGLYLVSERERHTLLLLRGPQSDMGREATTVQVSSGDAAADAEIARELRRLSDVHNVFRGQVLSFGGEVFGQGGALLQFHERPTMGADQLVLDRTVLAAIERQVIGVARHKDRLRAAGQHLKRGLLLYGAPGVGKTHTIRYLTSILRDTTVIQVTGEALHLIGEACSVARSLQPSLVVVEDVDLIAGERGMSPGEHPLLFQLLNEMDGLAEDADVAFVLTTNRADLLEPALASRPGRVDQAVELALPDLSARRRLFELYRGGLDIDTSRLESVLARAEGVTASFLKELLRRAAVLGAAGADSGAGTEDGAGDAAGPLQVTADDLDAALDDLLSTRNAMTRSLLGASDRPRDT